MYDAVKNAGSAMHGQFVMQPEGLKPDQLKRAKGLAGILTSLRKGLNLLFNGLMIVVVVSYIQQFVPEYITTLLIVLGVLYMLFKIRDYIRGTI